MAKDLKSRGKCQTCAEQPPYRFVGPTLGGPCAEVVKRASSSGVEPLMFDEPGASSSVPWNPTTTRFVLHFFRPAENARCAVLL